MARGFESKDVEFQQAEAAARKAPKPSSTPEQRETAARRRTIELGLNKLRGDLARAANPAHRQMLQQAIEDLEQRLREVEEPL